MMLRGLLAGLFAFAALALAVGYRNAVAEPVIRRATVSVTGWPSGAKPVTLALLSDVHLGNAATDRARFAAVAERTSALRPDVIVLAGDFIAGHAPSDAAVAPLLVDGLRRLRAPLGVFAVPGNHDHWTAIRRIREALAAGGAIVLANQAVRRGPIAIGGLDDMETRHADLIRTRAAMRQVGGFGVLVSHSPDIAPRVNGGLMLAGHTHCGQIVLPIYGSLADVSHYRERYRCGMIREGGRTTIVTAGIGTSVLPLRYGAPPDIWIIRLGH